MFHVIEIKQNLKLKLGRTFGLYIGNLKRQINNNYIRSACDKYDNDGISRVYLFKKDGSVDSTDNARDTQFDEKWKYSSYDSVFKFIGKTNSLKLKYIKADKDTLFLKFKEDFPPYKKNDLVYFVKYKPRSVPIYNEGAVIRFK